MGSPAEKNQFEHPFHGPRPKVMERMPDPPPPAPGSAFEIDERALREATEPNDKWLDTWPGKAFLLASRIIAIVLLIALIAAFALSAIAFPGFAVGLGIFASIIIAGFLMEKKSAPRR